MKTKERRTDKRGRVLHTAGERRELVAAFRSSGKTQAGFCREHGLNVTTLNGWLRWAAGHQPAFAEVTVPVRPTGGIEVELSNGVRVRLPADGQVAQAAELIRRLAPC